MKTSQQEDHYRSIFHIWAWPEEVYGIDFFKNAGKTICVLWFSTDSYSVELKHIASRKLFKRVPGLQDLKKQQQLTSAERYENQISPIFLAPTFGVYPL